MKFLKLNIFFLLIFISFIYVNCSKNDKPKTKTQLLSQTNWKISSINASGTEVLGTAQFSCIADNIFTFTSDFKLIVTEGVNICSPTMAGSYTWSFNSDQTQIILSSSLITGGNSTFNIVSITETTLTLSQNIQYNGFPVPMTLTFIH